MKKNGADGAVFYSKPCKSGWLGDLFGEYQLTNQPTNHYP